jgi:hypothetical protein
VAAFLFPIFGGPFPGLRERGAPMVLRSSSGPVLTSAFASAAAL